MTLLLTTVLVSCKDKNIANEADKDLTISISNLIDSLYTVDQKIQKDINEAGKNGENEKIKKLFLDEKIIFERHIPILKKIYYEIGYPTISIVGKENSSKFFTLVQHADSDVNFQEEMLKEIAKEVKVGNVSGKNFAFLTDRVRLAQGKAQIYGTQVDYNTDIAKVFPKNLVDSLNVNKRRKKIGLESIEEYLNEVVKIHFKMNKLHYDEIGIKQPKLYEIE